MLLFVPLQEKKGLLSEVESHIDPRLWREEIFFDEFRNDLFANYQVVRRRVAVAGAEFPDCEVFSPKASSDINHYVCVDEAFVPAPLSDIAGTEKVAEQQETSISQGIEISYPANEQAVDDVLDKTSRSDKFFNELRTVLSNEYVLPYCRVNEQASRQILSTQELLRFSRLCIKGSAGTGKTSIVRRLAFECGQRLRRGSFDDTPTPIYVQLRDFQKNLHQIDSHIDDQQEKLGSSHITSRFQSGQVLYIFDGVDELSRQDRNRFSTWVKTFSDSQPSLRIIVTSRDFYPEESNALSNFDFCEIEPFHLSQQYEYIHNRLPERRDADDFRSYLNASPALATFLSNPLTLGLAIALYAVRGLLPLNIGGLTQEIVDHLTEHWDEKRGIRRYEMLSAGAVKGVLGRLAAKLQVNGKTTFDSKYCSEILPYELDGAPEEGILEEIKFSTGLLRRENDTWAFSHRYFQDFFCASFMIDKLGGASEELEKFSADALWVSVWRQIGQLCSDPEFNNRLEIRDGRQAVFAIDRIVYALLAQQGLSLSETNRIVDGLVRCLKFFEASVVVETDAGGVFKLSVIDDDEEVLDVLNDILSQMHFLRKTNFGDEVVEKLLKEPASDHLQMVIRILKSTGVPRVERSRNWVIVEFQAQD